MGHPGCIWAASEREQKQRQPQIARLRLFAEEVFYVGNVGGLAVGGEALEEGLAVALGADSWVEEDEDTAVF
jgi:hypothetical protein